MNTPEQQLSESLLAACKEAGINNPKYITQDKDEFIYHFTERPYIYNEVWLWVDGSQYRMLDHPPYATDWQDSLLEWVEPCVNYVEDKSICDSYGEPKGQCLNCGAKDYEHKQGEPLADVLARHPESFAIETERNDNNEVTAHFIRNHKNEITEMIRPDHVADDSKMVDACDIACEKFMKEPYGDDYDEEFGDFRKIYHRAWSDALTWWDGSEQASGIESLVCADIAKRQQVGLRKYGTTLADNPLTHAEWLQHAYEECLNMAVYLKRAMAEKGGSSEL